MSEKCEKGADGQCRVESRPVQSGVRVEGRSSAGAIGPQQQQDRMAEVDEAAVLGESLFEEGWLGTRVFPPLSNSKGATHGPNATGQPIDKGHRWAGERWAAERRQELKQKGKVRKEKAVFKEEVEHTTCLLEAGCGTGCLPSGAGPPRATNSEQCVDEDRERDAQKGENPQEGGIEGVLPHPQSERNKRRWPKRQRQRANRAAHGETKEKEQEEGAEHTTCLFEAGCGTGCLPSGAGSPVAEGSEQCCDETREQNSNKGKWKGKR